MFTLYEVNKSVPRGTLFVSFPIKICSIKCSTKKGCGKDGKRTENILNMRAVWAQANILKLTHYLKVLKLEKL